MAKKYLVPKETFNCDLGIKTLWKQIEYEVYAEKPEAIAFIVPVVFKKEKYNASATVETE